MPPPSTSTQVPIGSLVAREAVITHIREIDADTAGQIWDRASRAYHRRIARALTPAAVSFVATIAFAATGHYPLAVGAEAGFAASLALLRVSFDDVLVAACAAMSVREPAATEVLRRWRLASGAQWGEPRPSRAMFIEAMIKES